jgi:hypothetical protein
METGSKKRKNIKEKKRNAQFGPSQSGSRNGPSEKHGPPKMHSQQLARMKSPSSGKIHPMDAGYYVMNWIRAIKQEALERGLDPQAHLRNNVPYWVVDFRKGTQIVQIRLYYNLAITVTASTTYSSVTTLQFSNFTNSTELTTVFDEYRPLRGRVEYHPIAVAFISTTAINITNMFGAAAIDYQGSAAFASLASASAHDTVKFLQFTPTGQVGTKPAAKWPVLLEPLPDEQWNPTSPGTGGFAWWKPYIPSTYVPAAAGDVGYLHTYMDFQFRGSQ